MWATRARARELSVRAREPTLNAGRGWCWWVVRFFRRDQHLATPARRSPISRRDQTVGRRAPERPESHNCEQFCDIRRLNRHPVRPPPPSPERRTPWGPSSLLGSTPRVTATRSTTTHVRVRVSPAIYRHTSFWPPPTCPPCPSHMALRAARAHLACNA